MFKFSFGLLLTLCLLSCKNTPKVGDDYEGGKVVSIDQAGHGLIIAPPVDQAGVANWEEAIEACSKYKGGGHSDWRLPTRAELKMLYEERLSVGGFQPEKYWTSQEGGYGDKGSAYYIHMGSGWSETRIKLNDAYFRAVRSF